MPNPHHELQRAQTALGTGDARAASRICQKLLTADPRNVEARYLHARCLAGTGQTHAAAAEFRRVLVGRPGFLPALVDLGIAETLSGNFQDARVLLEQARAADSRPAEVHFGLGLCQLGFDDAPAAAAAFRAALERNERFPDAHNNLGVAYDRQGDLHAALASFRRALELFPEHADAQRNLADVLARLEPRAGAGREVPPAADAAALPAGVLVAAAELEARGALPEAFARLQTAAEAQPDNADLQDACGALLHRMGRLPDALDRYERALEIDERRVQTHLNCGYALESMGSPGRAIDSFERALALQPDNGQVMAALAGCAFRVCDWDLQGRMLDALQALPRGIDELQEFLLLACGFDAASVAGSLRRRGRSAAPHVSTAGPGATAASALRAPVGRSLHRPLRVAYVSPDFRAHPVAYAIAGVVERHDRSRVTPIGVSLSPPESSDIGARLAHGFDEFLDVSASGDPAVVQLLRDREIDVAIDLAGLTTGSRPRIFALRSAPIQINYLGYPGSMGVPFMDYLIADAQVLPASDHCYYTERILRLPHSYLPFDDARSLDPPVDREAAGLPADSFVFCAFTSSFKLTRAMFAVWMSLLRDVPGSVLWLRSMGSMTAGHLHAAAAAHGIAADRLIFARVEERMEAHLARLQLADVFLDTLPYNAHTTASEALWAGVPVITCRGDSFAGRVGVSLLTACGMPDLICDDLPAYRGLALQLARSPARLTSLRARLRTARETAPLFDTARYTTDLENLLLDLPPDSTRTDA